MFTSATLSVLVLVLSGGILLWCAVQYARGRDRAVILLVAPLALALVIQSVGALFLSGPSAIAAVVVSMMLVVPAIIQSIRMSRQHRATRSVAGPR